MRGLGQAAAAPAPAPSPMPQGQPGGQPPMAGAPMQGQPAQAGQPMTQATPEEQALYERFVARGVMLAFDEKVLPKTRKALEGGGDPIEGLARTAANVVLRTVQAAEQNGTEIPGDVLLHGGAEIFENLADASKAARIMDFESDQEALEASFLRFTDHVRTGLQESGRIDQEAAGRDLAMLQEMDGRGELESRMMALAENDPRMAGKEG